MPHPRASLERSRAPLFTAGSLCDSFVDVLTEDDDTARAGAESIDWTEQDVVFLHWRLLQEVEALSDPETPLEAKLDTLRWVFTEREKDSRPFSFVNCLRVVGCSPLSPIAYCGLDPRPHPPRREALAGSHADALPRVGARSRRPQPGVGRAATRPQSAVDQPTGPRGRPAGRSVRLSPSPEPFPAAAAARRPPHQGTHHVPLPSRGRRAGRSRIARTRRPPGRHRLAFAALALRRPSPARRHAGPLRSRHAHRCPYRACRGTAAARARAGGSRVPRQGERDRAAPS